MAVLLATGRVPGWARQIGQVRVFSSSAQTFSQRQNSFVRVFSWTWISSPMTGSHSGMPEPFRNEVESKRALERVACAEEQVLRELRADQLEAYG